MKHNTPGEVWPEKKDVGQNWRPGPQSLDDVSLNFTIHHLKLDTQF